MIKISIITVCHNSQATIEDTINSIISQHYSNIEYIIIDGSSSDNSLEIVKSYGNKISKVVSEPDLGIYDAMNKGIALATGDVIGFLNSDDFYADNFVIDRIVEAFDQEGVEATYADLDYVSYSNKHHIVREWRSGDYDVKKFYFGWMPPHPTFFVLRSVYEKFGGYNLKLNSSADYELILRLCLLHKVKTYYIPNVLVKMRMGGQSNRSLKNRILANLQDRKAWSINGLKVPLYTLILKPLRKIGQYRL
ncbi:MAG: glycosyltransferase family 2 protein [Bacteroidota bacterium]